MASVDKENVLVTPKKATSPKEYSPSNPQKALKLVSPNKYNSNSVGKLNPPQNDWEDHLVYIHGSNEEIKQQLALIEVQTKQTNDDLEQLFDRLKNNNQHLNKLLESIAAYSSEVITEGNATKSDVSKILNLLGDLSPKNLELLVERLLLTSKDEVMHEIRTIVSKSQGDTDNFDIEVILRLTDIELSLKKLSENSAKNLEQHIPAETTRALTEPALLHHSTDLKGDTTDAIARKIDALGIDNNVILLLQQKVEEQSNIIKSFQKQILDQHDFTNLQHKHSQLQQKYDTLCGYYQSKYSELVQLEQKFDTLTNMVDKLDSRAASIDVQKYDRLHQMHTGLSQPAKTQSSFLLRRTASMPIRADPPKMEQQENLTEGL